MNISSQICNRIFLGVLVIILYQVFTGGRCNGFLNLPKEAMLHRSLLALILNLAFS